uniref:Trafficking kinesin-binding protein 1-like n=1 Tax=Callorhinchus milii TaxID=7868 RepID=A0A4W3JRB6_CALMI
MAYFYSHDLDGSCSLLPTVLCADRVGQVTKTYHDIEAVTHLLEEKERDLELAARIGQSLLKQNHSLTQRNEVLEEQLQQTLEEISQLKHELLMRDDLLQLYTDTTEDSDPNPTHSTALPWNASASSLHSFVQLDFLQQKLQGLEEENSRLRHQVPVGLSNNQLAMVSEELARKVEDCTRQQEEISRLLAHIVNLKQKCKACTTENEELSQHMASLRGSREQLKSELWELKERYAECKGFLQEAQEEIKNLRNKCMPNSSINRYHTVPVFPMDSIAAEIEGTMRKGLHGDSAALRRVFETVRAANQAGKSRSQLPQNIPGSSHSSAAPSRVSSRITTPRTSFYGSESSIEVAEDKTPSLNDENKDAERKLGTPGTPGCRDLEVALQRLSLSRESSCYESEREHKLTILASDGPASPADSFLSIGTNYSGSSGFSLSSRSLLPEKLKIVKPLEGSVTLHHWQQLAQPHFGGLLESRPGVLTKDFQLLELDMEQVYNLADLEEDEADMALYQKLLSLPTDPSPNSQGRFQITPPH